MTIEFSSLEQAASEVALGHVKHNYEYNVFKHGAVGILFSLTKEETTRFYRLEQAWEQALVDRDLKPSRQFMFGLLSLGDTSERRKAFEKQCRTQDANGLGLLLEFRAEMTKYFGKHDHQWLHTDRLQSPYDHYSTEAYSEPVRAAIRDSRALFMLRLSDGCH